MRSRWLSLDLCPPAPSANAPAFPHKQQRTSASPPWSGWCILGSLRAYFAHPEHPQRSQPALAFISLACGGHSSGNGTLGRSVLYLRILGRAPASHRRGQARAILKHMHAGGGGTHRHTHHPTLLDRCSEPCSVGPVAQRTAHPYTAHTNTSVHVPVWTCGLRLRQPHSSAKRADMFHPTGCKVSRQGPPLQEQPQGTRRALNLVASDGPSRCLNPSGQTGQNSPNNSDKMQPESRGRRLRSCLVDRLTLRDTRWMMERDGWSLDLLVPTAHHTVHLNCSRGLGLAEAHTCRAGFAGFPCRRCASTPCLLLYSCQPASPAVGRRPINEPQATDPETTE